MADGWRPKGNPHVVVMGPPRGHFDGLRNPCHPAIDGRQPTGSRACSWGVRCVSYCFVCYRLIRGGSSETPPLNRANSCMETPWWDRNGHQH